MFLRMIAALAFSGLALGQSAATGSVSGTATDPGGGVIPGAEVSVLAEGTEKTAITNYSGKFTLDGIAPGVYEMRAKLAGFLTSRKQVTVVAGRNATWNPVLRVVMAQTITPSDGTDPTDAALARNVYDAVVRHIFKSKPPSVLEINSLSLVLGQMDESEWPEPVRSWPGAMLAAVTGARKSVVFGAASISPPARLIRDDEYHSVWTVVGATRPPRLALTRIVTSEDQLDALVYYEFLCGSLCGEGTMLWLRRPSTSASWTVHKAHPFWVS